MDCEIVPYGHRLYDLLEIKMSSNAKFVLVALFPVQTLGLSWGHWEMPPMTC